MNTVISIRTDKDIKDAAQEVAKSVGISLSALVNAYLRQIVATRRIEFYAPEAMTPKLENLITEIESEINSNQVSKKFTTSKDFLTYLKK